MRRLRTWLLILCSLILVLAAAIVATWIFFGPAIASNIITSKLRGLGIEESTFEVERLSLHQINLSGIALGPDTWLAVKSATATYGPFDLLRGQLKVLTLHDAAWTIRADDAGIDWGLPAQEGEAGAIIPDLPFETIEIIRAAATIERHGEAARFDIAGSIERIAPNHLMAELALTSGDSELSVEAEAAGTEALTLLRIDARAEEAALPDALKAAAPEVLRAATAEQVAVSYLFDASRSEEARITAKASLERLALGPEIIEQFSIAMTGGGGMLAWQADTVAPMWQAAAQEGELTGLDSMWSGSGEDVIAGANLSLAGAPPPWLLDLLPENVAIAPPLELALPLIATYSSAEPGVRLELRESGEAHIRAPSISHGDIELGDVYAAIESMNDQPLLILAASGGRTTFEFAGRLTGLEAMSFDMPGVEASATHYAIEFSSTENGSMLAGIEIEDGEVDLPAAEMSFGGVSLRAPLVVSTTGESAAFPISSATAAEVSIAQARWRDRHVEGGAGSLQLVNGRLTGLVNWRPADGVDMAVRLNGDIAADSPRATLLFTSAPFAVEEDSPVSELVTGTPDWSVGGLFAIDALVGFGEGAPDPRILLTVEEGSVSRDDGEIALSGIDGSIELDRITPLLTPGVQRITLEGGRLGEVTVTGGEIEIRADGDGLVRFERFIASMGEYGVFEADPFTIDPTAPVLDTTIAARNMSLKLWLELIAEDRVRGEGTLAGRIHVGWDAARPQQFTIEDSTLAAQPSRGSITISEEHDLRDLLEKSDPRFRDDEFMSTVGEKIVAAVQDFAFTSLTLDFEETADGTEFHIVTRGRGRQGEGSQEIGSLTLNIHAPFRVLYLAVMAPERLKQFFDPPE